jgi:predicted ABC-type exoprotein transport system permease subunit
MHNFTHSFSLYITNLVSLIPPSVVPMTMTKSRTRKETVQGRMLSHTTNCFLHFQELQQVFCVVGVVLRKCNAHVPAERKE